MSSAPFATSNLRFRMTSKLRTLLAAISLTLCGFQFALSADGKQLAEIVLRDSRAPSQKATIEVPTSFLSRENSNELRGNVAHTERLHLILTLPVREGSKWKSSSVDAAGRVNAVLHLVVFPQQDDVGRSYLEPIIREAERKKTLKQVVDLGNGLTRYTLDGLAQQELYLWRDKSGRSVGTNCFQAVCTTHRTWEGIVWIYYYYGRELSEQMAEVDSRVEKILVEGLKRNR